MNDLEFILWQSLEMDRLGLLTDGHNLLIELSKRLDSIWGIEGGAYEEISELIVNKKKENLAKFA